MENEKKLYVAIDSDILRSIAYLKNLKETYGVVNRDKIRDPQLQNDLSYYARVLQFVKEDKVRLLIVDAVYQESKHSVALVDFMKNYCYFPNVFADNYQEKAEKARALAHAYCSEYKNGGETYRAPMRSVFIAEVNRHVPTNDAYIMAQATVENCSLVTGNKKDFIFNDRQNQENHERRIGICNVNVAMGYYEEKNGKPITPRPITLGYLAGGLKRDDKFGDLEQTDDKIEGRTLL